MTLTTKILLCKYSNRLNYLIYPIASSHKRGSFTAYGSSATSKFVCRHYQARKKSHYDVLEVSVSATQAQIKAAYYRLSLAHHPDQSKGDPEKFRVLTEAYETLKDVRKRNLYDKGFQGSSSGQTVSAKEASEDDQKKRNASEVSAAVLDTWVQEHYRDQLENREKLKQRRELRETMRKDENDSDAGMTVLVVVVLLLSMLAWLGGDFGNK